MPIFELLLPGFDAEVDVDRNGHLIRWVKAPNATAFDSFLFSVSLWGLAQFEVIRISKHTDVADGVDVVVDDRGELLRVGHEVDPTTWRDLADCSFERRIC